MTLFFNLSIDIVRSGFFGSRGMCILDKGTIRLQVDLEDWCRRERREVLTLGNRCEGDRGVDVVVEWRR